MCLICEDEAAFQAYMTYLDTVERRAGPAAEKSALEAMRAVDAAKQNAEAPDTTLSTHTPSLSTPSPFSCSPVDDD